MPKPVTLTIRIAGAVALVFTLAAVPAAAQEATPTEAPLEDPADIEAQILAYEQQVVDSAVTGGTAEERSEEAYEIAKLVPLDPQLILGDTLAVENYRVTYFAAAAAAQKIYDTFDAFEELRALTPEQAEEMFPDGGYDAALNAANDAHYWAVEDGAMLATDLSEARSRVVGGRALTEEQIVELDRLLGL